MYRLNYDENAHLYDEPFRDHELDPLLLRFLDSTGRTGGSEMRILDVGCGTDKQLCADRTVFPEMGMVGLDRFWKYSCVSPRARIPTPTLAPSSLGPYRERLDSWRSACSS